MGPTPTPATLRGDALERATNQTGETLQTYLSPGNPDGYWTRLVQTPAVKEVIARHGAYVLKDLCGGPVGQGDKRDALASALRKASGKNVFFPICQ